MESNLKEVLENFKGLKIAVVGDAMLDIITQGTIYRLNPEQRRAPLVRITKESLKKQKRVIGGAANVAANVAPFANCDFYGIVGNDFVGKNMASLFSKNIIGSFLFFEKDRYTIVKERIFDDEGEYILRLDYEEEEFLPISDESQEKILRVLKENIKNYNVIVLSDYKKGMFIKNSNGNNLAERIISIAKSFDIPVISDIKPSNIELFKYSTVICPNKKEAGEMLHIKTPQTIEELFEAGKALQEKFSLRYVLITRDVDGVFIYNDGKSKNLGAFSHEVYDPTGAGDSLTAGVALGLAGRLSIEDATEFGNMLAGIVVGKPGTAVTNPEEVLERYERIC